MSEDLPARWRAAVREAGGTAPDLRVDAVGAGLLRAYASAGRAYHDTRHLGEVLDRVDALAGEAADPAAVRLAAWFHDAVHGGAAGEDEERSALLAESGLPPLGVPAVRVAAVARLVRLTAGHGVAPGDRDGAVLADADLGILAADPGRYAEYAADVRREYAAVPDPVFAAARAAVLRGLLAHDPLFRTRGARAWEERARANVGAELAGLDRRAAAG